jgi:hypothetical protein
VDWFHLAQDTSHWFSVKDTVNSLQVPYMRGECLG